MKCIRKLAKWYLSHVPSKETEKYKGQRTPVYSEKYDSWFVETAHGVEYGDIMYIVSEFTHSGVHYHYFDSVNSSSYHEHSFSGVVQALIENSESFSIEKFESEYSKQEKDYLDTIKSKLGKYY